MTTMLETRHSDMLRQRFGVIATRACQTTEDRDTDHKGKKKAESAYRPLKRDDCGPFLMLWLMTMWNAPQPRLN